jgi:spore coat protein CotH
MLRNYYFYPASATLTIVIAYSMVLSFAATGNHQLANATNKVEYNSTSTICIDDRPCVTTICINNQQCHTITSNYTNTGNSTNNKHSIVSRFPQKNI